MPNTRRPESEAELIATAVALAEAPLDTLSDAERTLATEAARPDHDLVQIARDSIARGEDYLGVEFCRLRTGPQRRELGAFYTPVGIVTSMIDWAARHDPTTIVDAGCGSGRYALDAAERTEAKIVAVDLDPVATLMTRAAATVRGLDIDVRNSSFLTLKRDTLDGPVAWIGNPPYVRHHSLPAEVKAWAKTVGADLDVKVSGLAGLHALFFLAVAAEGRAGDVGTFITSSEWMAARYGSVVRDLLRGPLGGVRIDTVDPESEVFGDATTTATVTSFRVGTPVENILFRAVTDGDDLSNLDGGVAVPTDHLASLTSWERATAEVVAMPADHQRLRGHAAVTRGIATGANKFFVITATEAAARGLAAYARPVVSRAKEVFDADGRIRADDLAKVLLCFPQDLTEHPAVKTYVAEGEAARVHEGFLCKQRNPWWSITLPTPAAAFGTYMARQPPKFATNPDGVANLNNVHGLRLSGDAAVDAEALVAWLNANRASLIGGRTYQGGMQKIEPGDMANFVVPSVFAVPA